MSSVLCNLGPFDRGSQAICPACATVFRVYSPDIAYETVTVGVPPITITACFRDFNEYCDTSNCNGCYNAVIT